MMYTENILTVNWSVTWSVLIHAATTTEKQVADDLFKWLHKMVL